MPNCFEQRWVKISCIVFLLLRERVFSSAFERTLPQLHEMVELAGLKVKRVNATRLVTAMYNL